jgi:hypothetical protein
MKGQEEKPYKVAVVKPSENTGTAKAFVTIETRDGLIIRGISYHESQDGRKWIFLPGQPKLDEAGNVLRDPLNGRIQFYRILYFTDRDKWYHFQNWMLSELNTILPSLKQAKQRPPEFRGVVGGAS